MDTIIYEKMATPAWPPEHRHGQRRVRTWALAVDSHRDKLEATPNGAGSLTKA